jgi:NADH-quinone oxidoreductase subunit N
MQADLAKTISYLLPELVIVAGILFLLAWGLISPRGSSPWLSYIVLGILIATLVMLILYKPELDGGALILDGPFPVVFRIMIVFAAALIVFLSHDYLPRQEILPMEYYLLILLSTLGMMFTAAASHLLIFFLGIELMGLSFYIMVAMIPESLRSKEAAIKYLIYGLLASGIMLFGMSIIYGIWGSWDVVEIGRLAAGAPGAAGALALALLLTGIGFKIGLAPFHMWVPDVFDGSPAPVAAFLSVGPKIATFAAGSAILLKAFPDLSVVWIPFLGGMAVLSMIWGNLAALAQNSLKRMIAYSSIAHVGYIAIGLLAATRRPSEGLIGVSFYLFTYMFANIGLFALIVWMEEKGGEGPTLDDVAGLGRRRPALALAFTLFLVALAGIPPTSGFMAKFWVFMAAVRAKMVGLAIVGVLTSAVAVFYYVRVVYYFFMKEPATEGVKGASSLNIGLYVVLLAALTTIWFGIWPEHLLNFVQQARLP